MLPLCLLAVVAVAAIIPGVAHAEDVRAARSNNVTASGIDYGATAAYTRAISRWLSAGASVTYLPPGVESYSLAGAGLHVKYHPGAPRNPQFFAELNVRALRAFDIVLPDNIGSFGTGSSDTHLHTTALLAGAWVGWRWYWNNGINVGIGAGFDYSFASGGRCISVCVLTKRRVDARPLLDLGLAF